MGENHREDTRFYRFVRARGGGPKYTISIISVSIGPFLAIFGERVDDWTAWRWPVTKVDFGRWPG